MENTPTVLEPERQLQKLVASPNTEQVTDSQLVLDGRGDDWADAGAAGVVSREVVSVVNAVVVNQLGQNAYAHLASPEFPGIVESIAPILSLVQAHIVAEAVSEETELVVAEHDKSVGREAIVVGSGQAV